MLLVPGTGGSVLPPCFSLRIRSAGAACRTPARCLGSLAFGVIISRQLIFQLIFRTDFKNRIVKCWPWTRSGGETPQTRDFRSCFRTSLSHVRRAPLCDASFRFPTTPTPPLLPRLPSPPLSLFLTLSSSPCSFASSLLFVYLWLRKKKYSLQHHCHCCCDGPNCNMCR